MQQYVKQIIGKAYLHPTNLENIMLFRKILLLTIITFSFAQYEYSLEDINSSSNYYGENVGTSYFSDQVTLHYFGHYN